MANQESASRYLNHPISAGMAQGTDLRSHIMKWLVGQFGRPTGFWGHAAGLVMANRKSNIVRNLWTVDLLDIQPSERVLEIGFGPGIAIEAIASRLDSGSVLGVDHSAVMVRQATRRNRAAVRSGRVELIQSQGGEVPRNAGDFDKILAVNVAMFWEDPVAQFQGLRERLATSGRIALTLQPRSPKATGEDARRAGDLLCQQLRAAGFRNVHLETKPMAPVAAVCALGER